ncbi:hypothetical protein PI124_g4924 [Phytophthora idaei]|nr:hypothetical protein PI126_g1663 [Phytophthora idaei]KAG3250446.1 hypothetical protein PI124_g4924 [Phytophthora idaei]
MLLGVSAAVTFVLLCVLYFQRSRRYVNVLILMWFSAAQAATFVGLGVIFDTHIVFFNCGATFTWVLLMIFLVGVRLKKEEGTYRHLMSPLVAGALSFVAVVCASCILFIIYGTRFVTSGAFGYSLIFQFILLAWFAWDAAWIFQVVAVDEFAYGVIYIYTDIVLSFLFSVAVAGVAVGFASLMVVMLASCGEFDCSCCCECSFNDCSLLIVDTNTRSNAGISAGASKPARAQRHSNTASRTNDIQRDQRNQRMERV